MPGPFRPLRIHYRTAQLPGMTRPPLVVGWNWVAARAALPDRGLVLLVGSARPGRRWCETDRATEPAPSASTAAAAARNPGARAVVDRRCRHDDLRVSWVGDSTVVRTSAERNAISALEDRRTRQRVCPPRLARVPWSPPTERRYGRERSWVITDTDIRALLDVFDAAGPTPTTTSSMPTSSPACASSSRATT